MRSETFDRADVLDRAGALFAEKGYEGTSVQDLVDRLGLSRSSLYNSFGDKHALYLQAIDRYRARGQKHTVSLLDGGPALASIEGYLRTVGAETVGCTTCLVTSAAMEQGLLNDGIEQRARESLTGMAELFAGLIRRAQGEGDVPVGKDPVRLGRALANTVCGLRVFASVRPSQEEVEDIVEAAIDSLR
ncbi:MAG: TetR/AcrR family transcriptional regulator [Bacteroidota bacterium]